MGTRSLRASQKGIEKANIALAQYSLSQNALAEDLGLSRQTVNNFFKGKPIDRENFTLICERLGLDLESTVAIVDLSPETSRVIDSSSLDASVLDVRQTIYSNIQKRCGTMRVLDMEQPISIDSIYTKVNILEKISRNQRRTIAELLEGCDSEGEEGFNRFTLGRVWQKRIPGLEAVQRHDKLMILGKPGAGKTTFLKWLAIQCNEGQLYPGRVPVFITLKEFAETSGQPSLQNFISSQFKSCRVDNAEDVIETLLQEGRVLILLDGLDEVRDVDQDRVLQAICDTSTRFDASQFVITCRIAAREYTFERFREVEVADFDDEQIAEFSHKWFYGKDPAKAEEFPQELRSHAPLKELATNPLLLTLLCLVFEERAGFPANRAELYKEGLDVLLKKWDAKRNIRRDEVYKDLSLKRKEDLLSQIAFTTFEASEYFFKQKTVEQKIEQYICNLPNASTDPETLQIDSEAVLKSIEAQHGLLVERARGIYSFSHLTFHEYFTARRIEKRNELYEVLVSHITEKRWREVFLLTVGMIEEADTLLKRMKSEIDEMLSGDKKLQHFLRWVEQKSCSVNAPCKPAIIRAFYLALALDRTLARVLALALDRSLSRARDIDGTRTLTLILNRDINIEINLDLIRGLGIDIDLDRACDIDIDRTPNIDIDPALQKSLKELQDQLPNFWNNWSDFKQWWETNGSSWAEQLRRMMIEYSKSGHDWQFSDVQKTKLRQYYDANKLLVECLNSDCYVSREVREEIEGGLLMPVTPLASEPSLP